MNSSSVAQSNPVGAIRRAKWALWLVLGAMTLSILVFVEMPYLTTATFRPTTRTYIAQRLITIIPHLMCGFVALCIGPLQFSNRLRQANIKRHRLLGKIYVAAIVLGAIGAYLIVWGDYSTLGAETDVLASLWLITAVIAYIAARKRQIVLHRQWMIRSYAVTFSIFVVNRFPGALFHSLHHSEAGSRTWTMTLAVLAILIPDIAFTWSQLSGPRRHAVGQGSDRPVLAESASGS
jgi:uncharacterized membrane protein